MVKALDLRSNGFIIRVGSIPTSGNDTSNYTSIVTEIIVYDIVTLYKVTIVI